jgi:Malectin domain
MLVSAVHPRRVLSLFIAGGLAFSLSAIAGPASAVNSPQASVVSTNPADFTPQVMNGSVQGITQIGNKIVAVGTFTTVRQTLTSADITRNRIFAFDATTGAIDMSFNPNLGGSANSVDNDGTNIYVGGAFSSVGGNTAIKRVVKLTALGAVAPGFSAVPNSGVNEVVVRGNRLFVGGGFTNVKSGTTTTTRNALAGLDSTSGAVLSTVNVPFTGLYDPAIGGGTNVKRFDMTPDGSKLVAVGNFSTVGGQPRSQIAVVNTPTTGAAGVASWATNRYDADHNDCAGVFDTFMRDVDFSPDGSYFAVTATGAYAGGVSSGTLCDTTTRWETASTGNDPTWIDYTGGDTTYGVAVTGTAIYTGGHMRWQNNPYQGDEAGPGAVPREGIAALDPVNGLPLSWNPGRTRGVGAQALYATSTGLWVGSDTNKIGNPRETHSRIAFMPLAGGTTIPVVNPATLPNDLFLAERTSCSAGGVLYRVNGAGPALAQSDGSPDWTTDDAYRNTGNSADWGGPAAVDSTVPACTTPDIFRTERWDDAGDPEMHFGFDVPAGTAVKVRLYFADRYSGTSAVGSRVFNVSIDGVLKLSNFDINAAAGHDRGTMREFPITSDGTIDIDFGHVVENPLIDGIEIIAASGNGPQATPGTLLRRPVDGSGAPTGAATTANSAIDWSLVRGAFLVNGTLYYGLGDGGFYARTFNKTTGAVGTQRVVNLYDDPDTGERIPFAIANLTGMFYDTATHRIYYTLAGDSRLFYRYFTPQSEVVGAQEFVGSSDVDLSTVSGMTLAGGNVLYGSSDDGALRSVAFNGGQISGPSTVTSNDGTWRFRAIFVPNT